jgi:hypothetical protein
VSSPRRPPAPARRPSVLRSFPAVPAVWSATSPAWPRRWARRVMFPPRMGASSSSPSGCCRTGKVDYRAAADPGGLAAEHLLVASSASLRHHRAVRPAGRAPRRRPNRQGRDLHPTRPAADLSASDRTVRAEVDISHAQHWQFESVRGAMPPERGPVRLQCWPGREAGYFGHPGF